MPAAAGDDPRSGVAVRLARPADLPRIQEIYAHHVLHGLASFEETPPNLAEMTQRFDATLARGLPYLGDHDTNLNNTNRRQPMISILLEGARSLWVRPIIGIM